MSALGLDNTHVGFAAIHIVSMTMYIRKIDIKVLARGISLLPSSSVPKWSQIVERYKYSISIVMALYKLIKVGHLKPLREYCIKSSYNTALSGNYTSTDMIKYVLGRGCLTIVTVVAV